MTGTSEEITITGSLHCKLLTEDFKIADKIVIPRHQYLNGPPEVIYYLNKMYKNIISTTYMECSYYIERNKILNQTP